MDETRGGGHRRGPGRGALWQSEGRGGGTRSGGDRHGEGHGHRRGKRPLDHGEIRLLLLSLLTEGPRHGYDLIRAVEDLFGGAYTPSPGVIYPTLAWAEDMGLAQVHQDGTRKCYALTDPGRDHLEEHALSLQALHSRIGGQKGSGRAGAPLQVVRAMDNLKTALRLRIGGTTVTEAEADAIAAAIDAAARDILTSAKDSQ